MLGFGRGSNQDKVAIGEAILRRMFDDPYTAQYASLLRPWAYELRLTALQIFKEARREDRAVSP